MHFLRFELLTLIFCHASGVFQPHDFISPLPFPLVRFHGIVILHSAICNLHLQPFLGLHPGAYGGHDWDSNRVSERN
jgi:hypothetical protein